MPINSLVSLLIQCITLYYYPHFVMHTKYLPRVLFALKFSFFTQKKQRLQMHSHVCMAKLLYLQDFSQIEKKNRAACTKDGTVGLIIWHSRSYNKSMIIA